MMHSRFRRRVDLAERARLVTLPIPLPDDGGFTLTGPITLTITTTPPQSTSSIAVLSSSSSTTLSSSSSSTTFSTFSTALSDSSTSTPPDPVASAVNTSKSSQSSSTANMASDTSALGTRKLPAGAIVGIVIGSVVLLLALGVVLLRNRFIKNRKQRRATWLNKGGVSSMTVTQGSFAPAEKYPDTGRGEISPQGIFAKAQAQAIAFRPSIPAPAPLPTSYNNPAAVSPRTIPSSLPRNGATVKFTFIPSLPDELSISNGEVVMVLQEFDDSWALCRNERGLEGMVPMECLAENGEGGMTSDGGLSSGGFRNSRRESSLNIALRR